MEFKKSMSKSLFFSSAKMRLKPKSVKILMYLEIIDTKIGFFVNYSSGRLFCACCASALGMRRACVSMVQRTEAIA
jgi:hypothetical protein